MPTRKRNLWRSSGRATEECTGGHLPHYGDVGVQTGWAAAGVAWGGVIVLLVRAAASAVYGLARRPPLP
ncbi:hypothetical protein E2562_000510 [Oryza meyeriana var. granulata]|uniref:Uncharacterized protein n=1 Tax=Oryza meyeriana var. granulata TaxID=110450 RepID=A0A6G1CCB0_9ORYZ|nr:hypothetical protein E2562_000510 [Oryza meyeriana var. granulata]